MKTEAYPGYHKSSWSGVAYQHYCNTGEITTMWGEIIKGSGPPSKPMTEHDFYQHLQTLPQPANAGFQAEAALAEIRRNRRRKAERQHANITDRITGDRS